MKPDALTCQSRHNPALTLPGCSGHLGGGTSDQGCSAGTTRPWYWIQLPIVLNHIKSQAIHWGHASRMSCHAGTVRTLSVLKTQFWWPTMVKDVREYVTACPTSARGKTANQPPAGLLRPVPVPSRPWSHIALDFVTGLLPSKGNTILHHTPHYR